MKKINLPKNWVVGKSTSFPDRVYYFNVETNESSWDQPAFNPKHLKNEMSKLSGKRKKPSECPSSPETRPLTPEADCDKRPKLRAKRQLLRTNHAKDDDEDKDTSKDTPQMRALRERMMERQTKGNATKRSKIIKSPEIKNTPKRGNESVNKKKDNEQGMTPQMRTLLEKVQTRKSLGAPVTKHHANLTSKSSVEVPMKRILTRGMRAKSMGATALLPSTSSDESPINNTDDNNEQCAPPLIKPTGKKSRSCVVTEKLKLIRTVEAPPGVASKRIFVENHDAVTNKDESNDLSLDFALTQSSSPSAESAETPMKKSRIERVNNSRRKKSFSPIQNSEGVAKTFGDSSCQSESSDKPSPSIYKNAAERMRSLRNRLSKELQAAADKRKLDCAEEADSTLDSFVNTASTFYEEMEWEPVEEERIFYEIQSARTQINFQHIKDVEMNEIAENTLSLSEPDGKTIHHRALYIVIDTNVFLTSLRTVEEARDSIFKRYGRPVIVIPWTTIRELDFIKDDRTNTRPESLKAKARQAIRFLNEHFTAKHPRVLGQTLNDVALNRRRFSMECPDDEILQTCLQVRKSKNTVVLLSYDRNLCNKAMIHDITTLGRNDSFEKIDFITEFDCQNESVLAANLKETGDNSDDPLTPLAKELAIAEDLYEEIKTVLTSFLTVIVAKEMENLFGETWERYTIIKPPWTAVTVLKCAIKHWIAAVSDSFIRRAESIIKELHETINRLEYNRRLNDVENVIQLCFDLIQCLKSDKHPNILTKFSAAIDQLRRKHQEAIKELQEYQLNDEIGSGISDEEQESRAAAAFHCFRHIYDNARDMCGAAAQLMGMSCTFSYNKNNTHIDLEEIKNRRPEVAANVNRLLLILGTALDDIQQLSVNHRYVIALYNALNTLHNSLLPDSQEELSDELSPLDIYFCLTRKEKSLKIGVGQFQELSSHFCRMAGFKST